jgi:serine/threonine protein kinase
VAAVPRAGVMLGAGGLQLGPHARLDIAIDVGVGLAYLHGGGGAAGNAGAAILHRDIKSANVGLTLRGGALHAKLLDCSLAKAVRDGAGSAGASFTGGMAAGTVGYTAPEFANGVYTVSSEVFSFGVTLLELLTGRIVYPLGAAEAADLAEDEGAGALGACAENVWPPDVTLLLAVLITDCLKHRPVHRPAGMEPIFERHRAMPHQVIKQVDDDFKTICVSKNAHKGVFDESLLTEASPVLLLKSRRLNNRRMALPANDQVRHNEFYCA